MRIYCHLSIFLMTMLIDLYSRDETYLSWTTATTDGYYTYYFTFASMLQSWVWLKCWAIMMINIQLRMWLSKWRIKTRILGYHDILNHDHFYRCWDTTSQKLRGVVLGDSNIKLGRRTRCTWVFAVLRLTHTLHLKEDLLNSSLRVPHFARSDRWF